MRLDERGKQCPLPVIEAKKALESSAPGEKVEVVVDNEIAVQNLTKMADHKGFAVCSEKTGEREFLVTITAGGRKWRNSSGTSGSRGSDLHTRWQKKRYGSCSFFKPDGTKGDEVLGKLLMKAALYLH